MYDLTVTSPENETSQLEYVCAELGATAVITTKYHAEYAGEGIEYSWGLSKLHFRRYLIDSKQTADKFRKLVRFCISRDILTTEIVRRFSRRARQYMVGYRILDKDRRDGVLNGDITHTRIERMKLSLKCHRAAMDFDKAFVMTELKEEDFDFEHDVEIAIKKESGIVIPARRKQKDKKIREAPQMSPRRQQNKTKSTRHDSL